MAGPCLDPDTSSHRQKVISEIIRKLNSYVPDDMKEVIFIFLGVVMV